MPSVRRVAATKDHAYEVTLVDDLLARGFHALREVIGERKTLLVTSATVGSLYGKRMHRLLRDHGHDVALLVMSCSESSKVLDLVTDLCSDAARVGLGRKGLFVGLGGGVCTDIVTVAASWYRRGIDYVRIPTTLVGQIDAGIGIKGGVNFEGKKNFLGCFYPPSQVLADPMFLGTLPDRHIRCGLAEIIKIALACDAPLFRQVERDWSHFKPERLRRPSPEARDILWGATLKLLAELEPNLYEDRDHRRLADFGHTFSPPLEGASQFRIPHGEAVAIDMALTTALATRLGLLGEPLRHRILALLAQVGLPLWHPLLTVELCRAALAEAARHRGGCPNLVVPVDIGRAEFITDVQAVPQADLDASIELVREAARSLLRRPGSGCSWTPIRPIRSWSTT